MGVGGLIGLGVIALKQFKIWPFNQVGRVASDDERDDDEDESADDDDTSPQLSKRTLHCRHARSWTIER